MQSNNGHNTPSPHKNNNRIQNTLTTHSIFSWALLPIIIGILLLNHSPIVAFLSPAGEVFSGFNKFIPKLLLNQVGIKMGAVDVIPEDEEVEDDSDDDEAVIANFNRQLGLDGKKHSRASQAVPQSLPSSFKDRKSLFFFSVAEGIQSDFSVHKSTQDNFRLESKDFYGPFADIRAGLDYDYHGNYAKSRQEFQDKIVEKLLNGTTIEDSTTGQICKTPTEPWIVFTAGVMGAGKSHTMGQMNSKGLFPLKSYIVVDPDEIRSHFPEYHLYASQSPKEAGELTHREAGYVTEIVTEAALKRGYNVMVDGSLWDYSWYQEYFKSLHKQYPVLRIAIVHITAPREAVLQRAKTRGEETGRVVPLETLELSLKQVPISVKILAPTVDFFCELDNSPSCGEVTLATESLTWDSFRDNWAQTCPWVPGQKRG